MKFSKELIFSFVLSPLMHDMLQSELIPPHHGLLLEGRSSLVNELGGALSFSSQLPLLNHRLLGELLLSQLAGVLML